MRQPINVIRYLVKHTLPFQNQSFISEIADSFWNCDSSLNSKLWNFFIGIEALFSIC